MAINKTMLAALRAISYMDIDIKKTYKAQRELEKLRSKLYVKPPAYRIWDHEVASGDRKVPVRIFTPPDGTPDRTMIFFHGGGWVTGNIDTYDRVCVIMAKQTGHTVVSVDYSLAPESKFPAAPEDCYAVTREIMKGHLLGADPEQVTLIGDSAGGNLAAVVSLMARDRGELLPRRQILVYPSTGNDHTIDSEFDSIRENGTDYLLTVQRICDFLELYTSSEEDYQNPYFAPLLAKDLTAQPDTLIITAEFCPLRDEGEAYGKKLRAAGNYVRIHRVEDSLHGFFSLPERFAHVQEAYQVIHEFLQEESLNESKKNETLEEA